MPHLPPSTQTRAKDPTTPREIHIPPLVDHLLDTLLGMSPLPRTLEAEATTWMSATHTFLSSGVESVMRLGWSPAASLAERAVLHKLSKIQKGRLIIRTRYGGEERKHVLGRPVLQPLEEDEPEGEILVLNPSFWLRLAVMNDVGFAEAYMYGDITVSSLFSIFNLFIMNKPYLNPTSSSDPKSSSLFSLATTLFTRPVTTLTQSSFVGSIANTRRNISAHYDISNEMFASFLSSDMTYSCGVWKDEEVETYEAQYAVERLGRAGHSERADIATLARTTSPSASSSSTLADADAELDRSISASTSGATTPIDNSPIDYGFNTLLNAASTSTSPIKIAPTLRDGLYDSQMRKLRLIIDKADLKAGQRVLEIGTGWGSFAILAVQMTGCQIDTLTLSSEQASLARRRIKDAGLDEHIRVHLMDYRLAPLQHDPAPSFLFLELPEQEAKGASWKGLFDRFVAIEMMEHVGREFLADFWGVVDVCLKKYGDAFGVVQLTTLPEARMEAYIRDVDFIQKWVRAGSSSRSYFVYSLAGNADNLVLPTLRVRQSSSQIFPGCFIPSATQLVSTLESGTSGRLLIDSITNIGIHYSPTLRRWRERFEENFELIAESLVQQYPELATNDGDRAEELEVFRRKWIYYYTYCEFGFAERLLGDHILSFTREQNRARVPLRSRDF